MILHIHAYHQSTVLVCSCAYTGTRSNLSMTLLAGKTVRQDARCLDLRRIVAEVAHGDGSLSLRWRAT